VPAPARRAMDALGREVMHPPGGLPADGVKLSSAEGQLGMGRRHRPAPQRLGVEPDRMHVVRKQPGRPARAYLVDHRRRRLPAGHRRVVPALTLDPVDARVSAQVAGDPAADLLQAGRAGQRHRSRVGAKPDVVMRVDDARHHRAPRGADLLRPRPGQLGDLLIAADSHDLVPGDGDRLGMRRARLHGANTAVRDDQVSAHEPPPLHQQRPRGYGQVLFSVPPGSGERRRRLGECKCA
jgi:hypothetical protein